MIMFFSIVATAFVGKDLSTTVGIHTGTVNLAEYTEVGGRVASRTN